MLFGYPVTGQQIEILRFFGVNGIFWLWGLRLVSFLLVAVTLYIWFFILKSLVGVQVAKLSVLLVVISPLIVVLGLVYPLYCLKLLIFLVGLLIATKRKWFYGVLVLVLLAFNWQVLNNKASIYYKLNLKDAQTEVTHRISSEDSLKESIALPLWWRRIAYNKYFFSYKQIVAEVLPFFDFESIFFQEINPFFQKSIVIFYWPEIYLFVLGLYFIVNIKNAKLNEFLLFTIGLAWINFVFTDGSAFLRLVLVIFPLSIVVGLGFYNLYLNKSLISKISFYGVTAFVLFGVINSFADLNLRTMYWMDNRPLAFEFWYTEIAKLDLDKYNNVYISGMVGNSKPYCFYYLGEVCNSNKFIFESFDLTNSKNSNSVYAGFAGEFVGSDFKNDIDSNWDKNQNIFIIAKKSLRDTIANKYGNDVGVAIAK